MPLSKITCEVLKSAWRQTKDGFVLSLVIHPQDVSSRLATAEIGTRFEMTLVEITDDEPNAET